MTQKSRSFWQLFSALLVSFVIVPLCLAERPNVVVLMLDTLRADHLSLYGYERTTSPVIDKFGSENLVCNYAYTSAPWTPPGVASILTGLYATSHRMLPPSEHQAAENAVAKLDRSLETLPEIFKAQGYNTAGVSPNPWITKKFGYDQGFDSFTFIHRARGNKINEAGFKELDNLLAKKAPFFLYLHYLDPHSPYSPPKPFRDKFSGPIKERSYSDEELRKLNLYDGEISYLDTLLGELFERFKARGVYDDLIIVLVADHGEQFMERGNHGHGYQLFNEETRIPLIIKAGKGKLSDRINAPTSVIDIAPTVLSLAGIPVPSQMQGVNLLDKSALSQRDGIYTEVWRRFTQKAFVHRDGYKLIHTTGAPSGVESIGSGLFNYITDTHELKRLDDQARITELRAKLDSTYQLALAAQMQSVTATTSVDNETLEQLRSLGYMQ